MQRKPGARRRTPPCRYLLDALARDDCEELASYAGRSVIEPLVALALERRCIPEPEAVFIDPLTREHIEYSPFECDRHGLDLVLVDEEGAHVGTARAALMLDGVATRYFAVLGALGPYRFHGVVAAASEEDVLIWAEELGVDGREVAPLEVSDGELW